MWNDRRAFGIILLPGAIGKFNPLISADNRVATAQGKQGIWLLTFPDRENTGNLVNLIFYTGKIVATQGKFWKLLLKWQQGDGAFLS